MKNNPTRIWWKPWYEDKSVEFLEDRYARKPMATGFIIFSFIFFLAAATRQFLGMAPNPVLFIIAVACLLAGTVWFRIAYLSQEELKRRGLLDYSRH